ncbi:hypothetical protein B0H94_1024 [Salsuginibacillus halophilus]|uniref:NIPSNAP protein n=1 Tax=Salsuginibacillus halophilus TaxID=517424 RepID=A0A2P8HWY9_9BACI|nr:DUF6176 family protein [Salsuginibacillus halophilus]PSL50732.1 hypothetical protein B0H94_1024 [Salsuginibacillus halophilus]
MKVELTRFKVKEGKSKQVDEWMRFLNEHMEDVLLTLENEKMYVETIFREVVDNQEYLYWYSVEGEGGQAIEESNHWVDQKHLAFWEACIDETYRPVDLQTETVMIPGKIKDAMS